MAHQILIMMAALFLLASCKNSPKSIETSEQSEQPVKDDSEFCYLLVIERDTIAAHLFIRNNTVKGFLDYLFFEKDQNSGIVEGTLKGDTIIAEYKFTSEGFESVREIAFLKSDDGIIEGHGDMMEKGSMMVFKNLSSLKFDTHQMQKVDCSRLSK